MIMILAFSLAGNLASAPGAATGLYSYPFLNNINAYQSQSHPGQYPA